MNPLRHHSSLRGEKARRQPEVRFVDSAYVDGTRYTLVAKRNERSLRSGSGAQVTFDNTLSRTGRFNTQPQ